MLDYVEAGLVPALMWEGTRARATTRDCPYGIDMIFNISLINRFDGMHEHIMCAL